MTYRRIHFVGIGGIGMSALAQLYAHRGAQVSGSDRDPSSAVQSMLVANKILVIAGHAPTNVPADADLVVYSDAVVPGSEGYPEREAAEQLGIRTASYFEALGEVTRGYQTIVVSGAHGKTTTTAMVADILEEAGIDPTVIVGSLRAKTQSNFKAGNSKYVVVEGDEYRRHFHVFTPHILVITNIEADHLDYYRDTDDIVQAFHDLAIRVPQEGAIVCDPSSVQVRAAVMDVSAPIINYRVVGDELIPHTIRGAHNRCNAKAAIAAAGVLGVSNHVACAALTLFSGTWRRFERKGKSARGALVYDDYAHHPTEVSATLAHAREVHPDKRLTVVFHPHLFSRTEAFFRAFAEALSVADEVYILPVFPARERAEDFPGVDSRALVRAVNDISGNAVYVASHKDVLRILQTCSDTHIIITMGAGDVYKVADALVVQHVAS